jgi:hypothetical protein
MRGRAFTSSRFIAIALVLTIAGAAVFWALRMRKKESPLLDAPTLALASLSAKSLFFNPAAKPWLLAQRPELLVEDDRDERSERARMMRQAVEIPKLFRQCDRKYRFDTLLLVGEPGQSRQLIEHLVETQDWTLSYVDHTSIVFKRDGAAAWQPADLERIARGFAEKREQARVLALAAVKLLVLRRNAEARACLDRAEALDARVPEIWNAKAIERMNRGEWGAAKADADHALALDEGFLPALATKTQVLFSTKKFDEAFRLSERLVAAHPNDPALLFYHAKISHQAHAFTAEVRALRRLIERAEAAGHETIGYRIYLAQAHAAAGDAEPAITEFTRALADPAISAEQRDYAEKMLAQIKTRSGLR